MLREVAGVATTSVDQETSKREHGARRFAQIQAIQRSIELKEQEVRDSQAHTKELKAEADALYQELRAAARDEGDLPLLDMMDETSNSRIN